MRDARPSSRIVPSSSPRARPEQSPTAPRTPRRPQRFTEAVLGDDEKNYHAWSHRLAVVRLFGLWEQELGFTAKMLERDVHNNSAWNQARPGAGGPGRGARRRAACV